MHYLNIYFQVASAIFVLSTNPAGSKESEEKIESKMKEAMGHYGVEEDLTIAWNLAQNNLECCGVTNSDDWTSVPIPESCYKDAACTPDFKTCESTKSSTDLYGDGCLTKVEAFVKGKVNLAGGISIGVCLLQVFGVIFAFKRGKEAFD